MPRYVSSAFTMTVQLLIVRYDWLELGSLLWPLYKRIERTLLIEVRVEILINEIREWRRIKNSLIQEGSMWIKWRGEILYGS